MDRIDIINMLIDKYNYQSYLEIGLDMAAAFLKVDCKYKECVDPFIYEGEDAERQAIRSYIEKNILTYKMTSDEFFETIPEEKKYDIVFIDGLHTEEQVGRDIINSLRHLNDSGTIVCHDCLPPRYEVQLEEPYPGTWTGSVWKAIPMLKFQGIAYATVDADLGCCVIQYNGNKDTLTYPSKAEYDFHDVFDNIVIRNIMMNVITEEAFNNFINS